MLASQDLHCVLCSILHPVQHGTAKLYNCTFSYHASIYLKLESCSRVRYEGGSPTAVAADQHHSSPNVQLLISRGGRVPTAVTADHTSLQPKFNSWFPGGGEISVSPSQFHVKHGLATSSDWNTVFMSPLKNLLQLIFELVCTGPQLEWINRPCVTYVGHYFIIPGSRL